MSTPHIKNNKSARDLLLDTAEEIFLSGDFDGVSVRELTDAAGVNVAAVNYHFGGKRNLFLEVLRRHFTAIAGRKRNELQKIIAARPNTNLRQLVSTYVSLYIGNEHTMLNTQNMLRLVSRELADDNDAMELLTQELIFPVHQLMKEAIGKTRPDLDEKKISLCISSIVGQVFHFARCPDITRTLAGSAENGNWLSDVRHHIIEFSLKGLEEERPCEPTL